MGASHQKPQCAYAAKCFGEDRLIFGSDWPVCLLAGSYGATKGALEECLMKLGPHLRDKAVWRERSTKSLLCDFIWKWRIPPSVHRSNASSSDFDLEQHAMITSLAARWRLDRTESRWSGIPSITLS
jgi:hypothetical protein